MYDYGITYFCLFPGGRGFTSSKSVADKIYWLGKKMHDENGDKHDDANDDESPNKEAGLSLEQGGQVKELGVQKTEDSRVNGDGTSEKEASPSTDQGDQLEIPAEHNTDGPPLISPPEQDEKEKSTLVTSPLTIASKIKQILNGNNEKYGVVQALNPHSLDQNPKEESVSGVRNGWIEIKCRCQSLDLGYAVSPADIQ